MEKTNRGIMMAAPAAMAVLLLGVLAPGTALFGAQKATTDSVGPRGYVVVEAKHPDGTVFYRNEDHNVITTVGKDFIAGQIGNTTGISTNGANFIGLSTDTKAADASDKCISTTNGGTTSAELTANGLGRAQGTFAHTTGQNTYTVTKTFTAATAGTNNVQKAGLFTATANGDTCAGSNDGTMMAENIFTPVSLAVNDQLTITWTITLS